MSVLAYRLRMIRSGQIRAARGLLDWTQAQLARAAGLSQVAVKNLERGRTDPRARTPSIVLASFFSTRETPATAGPAYGSNNRTQLIGTQGEIAGASPARPFSNPIGEPAVKDDRRFGIPFWDGRHSPV